MKLVYIRLGSSSGCEIITEVSHSIESLKINICSVSKVPVIKRNKDEDQSVPVQGRC